MYYVTRSADKTQPYVTEVVVDTVADVEGVPTATFAPGSTIIVLEDASVYMLNTSKEWKKL